MKRTSPKSAATGIPALSLPFALPFPPMEAKRSETIPSGDGWIYEPKWDGFRALVFREGDALFIQSKSGQPLARYFPAPSRRQHFGAYCHRAGDAPQDHRAARRRGRLRRKDTRRKPLVEGAGNGRIHPRRTAPRL
ncbi:MAG: hypothetical protein ACYC7A_20600 [Thermoanaerobaculia bacterium]